MKTVILISSCDHFKECWEPLAYSFEQYWPDCPFPTYIISNQIEDKNLKIKFLKIGKDNFFASNLKAALVLLDCDFVIYFQDDYFLSKKVDTKAIQGHVKYCWSNKVGFLKIHANDYLVRDHLRIDNSIYCKNPIDVRYSLNTSIAIWNKETLESLCIEGYSGWDWERNIVPFVKQNKVAIKSEILHSTFMDNLGIKTIPGGAVAKGRWTKNGVLFLEENGFSELLKTREKEGKIISSLGEFYNKNPRSFLRFPIALLIRAILKLNVNI